MADALVRVENVSKQYRLGDQWVPALTDVTLNIEDGVFLAIAGPSGSGKSTLLNLIGCIDTPTQGRIVIDGTDTTGRSPDDLAPLRARKIGFIFQTFNLFPVLTAEENVEYPLLQFPELAREERTRRVRSLLKMVGLQDHARHRPNELSGGQRQRVAIARALVTRPRIILADEPTANLDSRTGAGILQLMKNINRSYKTTFVFSTHDKKVIAKADRLIRIEDGRVRRLGVRTATSWVLVRAAERIPKKA
ncbi:MAG TPA: ABC transporter ATP-binding protein [Burkholderiales bacterium]|nr:ABC transporter ATP-binding protein [Burkholderiales bacterium]